MKKLLMAGIALSALMLSACNDKEETNEPEEIAEKIDFSEAATTYKTNVMPELTAFVEDAKLLQTYIEEGNVEEAAKLYPIVHMHVERLKPIRETFKEAFEKIDAPLVEGKELETGGLHAIEYGLFEAKDASVVKETVAELIENIVELANTVATSTLQGDAVLNGASKMLQDASEQTLVNDTLANAQVYDVQANLEAIHMIVNSFGSHTDEETEFEFQQVFDETLDIVSFYEVGKEDYINYSFFTEKQKQDLIQAFKATKEAFDTYVKAMK